MIGSDTPPGMHVRQRLELRQLGLRQPLGVLDELHHLLAPVRVELLPVRVVVERPLLKLLRAAGDLGGVGDGVAADVDTPVDDSMVDSQRRGQAVNARVRGAKGAVRGLRGHHVESRHRFREVHGIVKPEAVVIRLAELGEIRVRRLGPLGSLNHLQ